MSEKQKILIVDDRRENRVALQQILRELDAEVIEASSGNEALAATLDHEFAVAIVDVQMPGMSGYELVGHMRGDRNIRMPLIMFLTATYPDEQHVFKGYESGGVDYLTKPYAPEILLGKLRIYLEMDRNRRELEMHRDHLETLVGERTEELKKRVKELKCLYDISTLTAEPCKSIDKTLKAAVDLIPPGWQYTGITRARIVFEGREFASPGFRDTAWKQSADLAIPEETVGTVEVCYLEERPVLYEGPFLREERDLIINIARHLGVMVHRERTAEALREGEERYRSLFESAKDGILLLDFDTGMITDVNPLLRELLGYSREELLGKRLWEVPLFKGVAQSKYAFIRLQTQDYIRCEDLPLETKNGEKVEVEFTSNIYKARVKKVIQCNIRDITERKRAEAEREKLEDQLRQMQKMEAIGQLAGGVAHDFNNMLSVINGYSDMLLMEIPPSDPSYSRIQEINKAGERSANLTRQLLAFARRQTIAPKVLDLNDAVEGMLKMLRRLIGENIELLWKPAANLWKVKIDPSQLNQVMINLVVNARGAIHDPGKEMAIETGNADLDEAFCETHPDSVPGKHVVLEVRDNGCGMDKETIKHIFEPFFTTKKVGEGTGLGLATVFGIVKQNNGFINVHSEPGKGSTFKIYLPRHESDDAEKNEKAEKPRIFTGAETILLVEDEEVLLQFAQKLLERMGYTVLVADNPLQAIKLSEEYKGEIHLLMTDVVMPKMSGRDLRDRISSGRPGINCLFVSGYTADVIAQNGVLDKGVHFLQKPFTAEALSAKLREALS
ncbi:MAG: response regulator [Victivallales bacterium]